MFDEQNIEVNAKKNESLPTLLEALRTPPQEHCGPLLISHIEISQWGSSLVGAWPTKTRYKPKRIIETEHMITTSYI